VAIGGEVASTGLGVGDPGQSCPSESLLVSHGSEVGTPTDGGPTPTTVGTIIVGVGVGSLVW